MSEHRVCVRSRSNPAPARRHTVFALVLLSSIAIPPAAVSVQPKFVVNKPLSEYTIHAKPLGPQEALQSFQLPDDLSAELVAAEPVIEDPVAIAFDDHARLFVVEMKGYPLGKDGKGGPQSRIKLLEDKDGDGTYETAHVFVDDLTYPNSVAVWDGGIYVTCAPNVYYFKDTTGDNHADQRRVVFSGFGLWNQQHLANGLVYGLDNRLYVNNGDSGGVISSPKFPLKRVPMQGVDFRFTPGSEAFESISGQSQFGTCFNDWGRRFICNNRNHCREMILSHRYLKRNPYLAVTSPHTNVSDHGDACKLFPISKQPARWIDLDHVDYITAACGNQIYRGDLLPEKYRGRYFVCDPVSNLVHMDVIDHDAGPAVTAKRAYPDREFFATTDPWSRPANVANGPDGALYVVDMYRQIIEHPQWIPKQLQDIWDLQAGSDRGRIYRIVPKDKKRPAPITLASKTTAELVALLAHPNGWVRDNAQRKLFARQDRSAVDPLKRLVRKAKLPQAKVHALWALHGLNALDAETISVALSAPHVRVREHAARLSEPFLKESAELREKVIALADDSDARLRFQVAFTLGEAPGSSAVAGLARIAVRDIENEWTRIAVLSSVRDTAADLLEALLAEPNDALAKPAGSAGKFLERLCVTIGISQNDGSIARALRLVADHAGEKVPPWWSPHVLNGIRGGLRKGRNQKVKLPQAQVALLTLLRSDVPAFRRIANEMAVTFKMTQTEEQIQAVQESIVFALDPKHSVADRVLAIRLVALGPLNVVADPLEKLLQPTQPPAVQDAALTALLSHTGNAVADRVLKNWRPLSPSEKKRTLNALLSRKNWLPALLTALESDDLPIWTLNAAQKQALLASPDQTIQQRSRKLFAAGPKTDFAKKLAAFQPALSIHGRAEAGKKIFTERCAPCHKIGDVGHVVGPDLTTIRNRPKESLLEDILDPSRAVNPSFLGYIIQTTRNEVLNGLIEAQTANSVTLRKQGGEADVILRQNIQAMVSTTKSLMPEDLEKDLTPTDMADLLAFLKSLKSARGPVAYYRFEEKLNDEAGSVNDQAAAGKGDDNHPEFVTDVPAQTIYDPVADKTLANRHAIRCDGKDDYLRLGKENSPDLTGKEITLAQTIEFFVKVHQPAAGADGRGLLVGRWTQSSEDGDHFAVFLTSGGVFYCEAQIDKGAYNASHGSERGGKLDDGQWHHVAAVFRFDSEAKTGTVTIFQDHKPVGTRTFSTGKPLRAVRQPYQLGGEGDAVTGPFRFVNATFDEVRISNEPLEPNQFLRPQKQDEKK